MVCFSAINNEKVFKTCKGCLINVSRNSPKMQKFAESGKGGGALQELDADSDFVRILISGGSSSFLKLSPFFFSKHSGNETEIHLQ